MPCFGSTRRGHNAIRWVRFPSSSASSSGAHDTCRQAQSRPPLGVCVCVLRCVGAEMLSPNLRSVLKHHHPKKPPIVGPHEERKAKYATEPNSLNREAAEGSSRQGCGGRGILETAHHLPSTRQQIPPYQSNPSRADTSKSTSRLAARHGAT